MAKSKTPTMPASFGNRVGNLKNLKKSLKSGTGLLRYIPKSGSLTVRFLEEPENWVNFYEHYDQQMKKSYPCIGTENNCPGCATEERRSSRYLANALDVNTGKVIALQLPKDLTNSLVRKYERFDTLMDRDYILSRDGEGLDTEYDADAEAPMKRKLTAHVLFDLQDLLAKTYNEVFGTDDDEDEDADPKPAKKPAAKAGSRKPSKAAQKLADEDEEDEDEDEDEEPAPKGRKKMTPPARDADEDDDDDEDEDDEDDEDADDDEDGGDEDDDEDDDDEDPDDEDDEDGDDEEADLDREELEAMTLGQLRVLAKEYEGEDGEPLVTTGLKKAQIIDLLVGPDDE